jgi:hypothetical protein
MAGTEQFVEMWAEARERVLTRYAQQARSEAERLHAALRAFPLDEAELKAEAAGWERYAQACELAAADPSLPTPDGTSYGPSEVA